MSTDTGLSPKEFAAMQHAWWIAFLETEEGIAYLERVQYLKDTLGTIVSAGRSPATTSAIATLLSGTESMEAYVPTLQTPPCPETAQIISSVANRLMVIAQKMGLPLMPKGVGDRPAEDESLFDTDDEH